LRDIVRYIANDDRETAKRFGDFLVSKVDLLLTFPRICRIVPEFREDLLREVLRIWHGARCELDLGEGN